MEKAERDKQLKYNTPEVVEWTKAKYGRETSVEVCGLILDWRGAWAKKSWKTLSRNGFNSGFMETLSFKVLRLSKWIHSCIYSRTDDNE